MRMGTSVPPADAGRRRRHPDPATRDQNDELNRLTVDDIEGGRPDIAVATSYPCARRSGTIVARCSARHRLRGCAPSSVSGTGRVPAGTAIEKRHRWRTLSAQTRPPCAASRPRVIASPSLSRRHCPEWNNPGRTAEQPFDLSESSPDRRPDGEPHPAPSNHPRTEIALSGGV
jgi:hypothetical protein